MDNEKNPPSAVLFIRNLPYDTNERTITTYIERNFSLTPDTIIHMANKNMCLLKMKSVEDAKSIYECAESAGGHLIIRTFDGTPYKASVDFSRYDDIKPKNQQQQQQGGGYQHHAGRSMNRTGSHTQIPQDKITTLFVVISLLKYQIHRDTIMKVFGGFNVQEAAIVATPQDLPQLTTEIALIEDPERVVKALVKFHTHDEAVRAMEALNGRFIYTSCCRMDIKMSFKDLDVSKAQGGQRFQHQHQQHGRGSHFNQQHQHGRQQHGGSGMQHSHSQSANFRGGNQQHVEFSVVRIVNVNYHITAMGLFNLLQQFGTVASVKITEPGYRIALDNISDDIKDRDVVVRSVDEETGSQMVHVYKTPVMFEAFARMESNAAEAAIGCLNGLEVFGAKLLLEQADKSFNLRINGPPSSMQISFEQRLTYRPNLIKRNIPHVPFRFLYIRNAPSSLKRIGENGVCHHVNARLASGDITHLCFAEFPDISEAARAIVCHNGHFINGTCLNLSFSRAENPLEGENIIRDVVADTISIPSADTGMTNIGVSVGAGPSTESKAVQGQETNCSAATNTTAMTEEDSPQTVGDKEYGSNTVSAVKTEQMNADPSTPVEDSSAVSSATTSV